MRPDADLDYTVAELVDGAFFNSGQSCCAIEVCFESIQRPCCLIVNLLRALTENLRARRCLRAICCQVCGSRKGIFAPLIHIFPSPRRLPKAFEEFTEIIISSTSEIQTWRPNAAGHEPWSRCQPRERGAYTEAG